MTPLYQKSITKEEINLLPLYEYHGRTEIIVDEASALKAIEELSREKILGFDTETKPVFQAGVSHKVALLQLAGPSCVYLFRLNMLPVIKELSDLLSDASILKAGVAIADDLKGLQKIFPFTPGGFVDLSKEAEKRGYTSIGLRPLTAIFMGQRLSKKAKISNWERHTLTDMQISYAASDALVGLLIYQKLMEEKNLSHK